MVNKQREIRMIVVMQNKVWKLHELMVRPGQCTSEWQGFCTPCWLLDRQADNFWVLEQYIQGDIFCWHIFVRSSVSSGHTCLSGHCPSLIFAEFHFQFIFKIILYSPLHRSSGFPWSFYVIRFWLSNQIGLGPANCSQVLPLNLWKTFILNRLCKNMMGKGLFISYN